MKRAPHLAMTEKQFRKKKLKQLKKLRKACDRAAFGCVYMPPQAYTDLSLARDAIERVVNVGLGMKKWK